jgi:hypothetical protein
VKLAIWAGLFLLAVAAGAWVASRTDPFPPGVEDPGARTVQSPSPEPQARFARWLIAGRANTEHEMFVGGTCSTDWTLRLRPRVSESGQVQGSGRATLIRDAICDQPNAQVQTRVLVLDLEGMLAGNRMQLRARPSRKVPLVSSDLGGLVATIDKIKFVFPYRAGVRLERDVRRTDQNRGDYVAEYTLRLRPAAQP